MKNNELSFRISSALKNLIGKELITDEFVAVFELVKNSYDAHATKVEIIFENLRSNVENRKLIIKDNGKGMTLTDLKEKWLFVAYSAKASGIEDNDLLIEKSYRSKIKHKRAFAGAKGIGRFSCDRLGHTLNMFTLKNIPESKIEHMEVHWQNFEKDPTELFIDISVNHETLSKNPFDDFNHGTILVITGLHDEWKRDNLIKLKQSLEKLISPFPDENEAKFEIELIVEEELLNDSNNTKGPKNAVNGIIENVVFEKLGLKTTKIVSEIIDDGKIIRTSLNDRGTEIYSLTEKNPFSLKSNVCIHLYELNRSAKISFKRLMGVSSVEYGSVFLYKNGFRIYPFGEEGVDLLMIDRRKQQGHMRFLGTRDLIGRIEIYDYDNIDDLKETTSRDGGLIKNKKYKDLVDFFRFKALRRLEKYVVDLIKWGNPSDELQGKEIEPEDIAEEVIAFISNIARDSDVVSIKYDISAISRVLDERKGDNLTRLLNDLEILASKTEDLALQKQVRSLASKFNEHHIALIESQKEIEILTSEKEEVDEVLQLVVSQNRMLQSIATRDFDQIVGFMHQIGIFAHSINAYVTRILKKIRAQKEISIDELSVMIEKISFENSKILSFAQFATKSGFHFDEAIVEEDLISFVLTYLGNVRDKYDIQVTFTNKSPKPFVKEFRPIDIILIVDNLLSNARKHKATEIVFHISCEKEMLMIMVSDNGIGLDKSIVKPSMIFEKGISTTNGAGLGLYFVSQILQKMSGSIEVNVNSNSTKGIELIIRIHK